MRIRHYGLLANCRRAHKLARSRELLGVAPPPAPAEEIDEIATRDGNDAASRDPASSACPVCGKPMQVVEIIAPQRRDTS